MKNAIRVVGDSFTIFIWYKQSTICALYSHCEKKKCEQNSRKTNFKNVWTKFRSEFCSHSNYCSSRLQLILVVLPSNTHVNVILILQEVVTMSYAHFVEKVYITGILRIFLWLNTRNLARSVPFSMVRTIKVLYTEVMKSVPSNYFFQFELQLL